MLHAPSEFSRFLSNDPFLNSKHVPLISAHFRASLLFADSNFLFVFSILILKFNSLNFNLSFFYVKVKFSQSQASISALFVKACFMRNRMILFATNAIFSLFFQSQFLFYQFDVESLNRGLLGFYARENEVG